MTTICIHAADAGNRYAMTESSLTERNTSHARKGYQDQTRSDNMQYLDAYHLSSEVTQADQEERYRQDRTCNACGFDDIKCAGHECHGYPEDRN